MLPLAFLPGLNATVAKWAVVGLAIVGLTLGAYRHGRHVAEGEIAEAQRTVAIAYAARIVEQQDEADRLAEQNAAQRSAREAQDRVITKEITRYVETTPAAIRCRLPGTFRLLHDAAATGQPAFATTGPLADAAADPVEDATALEIVGDNYAACRDAIAKLEGWQRRQRALPGTAP
jgi:hypothetical protein